MLPFIGKGLGLLKSGWGLVGTVLKGGLVVGGVGAAGAVADQTLNNGKGWSSLTDGIGGMFGRGMQEAAQTEAAAARDLEVASTSSGFQGFFSWLGNAFAVLGMDSAADWCQGKVDQIEERAFKIDQERKEQREMLEYGGTRPQPGSPEIDNGEWSIGSAFGSVAYGLEEGLVSMGTGVTSIISGSYEAATTDKGWGASIADDFNAQQDYVMGGLESLHGKPDIDTPLEKGLSFAGNALSLFVPVGLAAKTAPALTNVLRSSTPALGLK